MATAPRRLPQASHEVKEAFITDKYINKLFVDAGDVNNPEVCAQRIQAGYLVAVCFFLNSLSFSRLLFAFSIEQALFKAIESNNMVRVHQILAFGANPNVVGACSAL